MEYAIVRELIQSAKNKEASAIERALLNLEALPIPWAWEGCCGIRASGEVVYVDDDGNQVPLDAMGDPRESTFPTLIYAAERNPDLACLLPERPESATSCEACKGSGRFRDTRALCYDCLGLGWIDAK